MNTWNELLQFSNDQSREFVGKLILNFMSLRLTSYTEDGVEYWDGVNEEQAKKIMGDKLWNKWEKENNLKWDAETFNLLTEQLYKLVDIDPLFFPDSICPTQHGPDNEFADYDTGCRD